ncbi:hypothetical protein HY642_00130 [Candidatus Woesearchaeota archaeon]|nr:hypothetical protein [Candidatus Woesearchaeota archaeon]
MQYVGHHNQELERARLAGIIRWHLRDLLERGFGGELSIAADSATHYRMRGGRLWADDVAGTYSMGGTLEVTPDNIPLEHYTIRELLETVDTLEKATAQSA